MAVVVAVVAAPAAAAQVVPLSGEGRNVEAIKRVNIENPTEVELAGDRAFVAVDEGKDSGLVIVNIANPRRPYIESRWRCNSGWADVDLTPDASVVVLTNAHLGNECIEKDGDQTAVALIDVRNRQEPRLLSSIPYSDDIQYVHTATLDNDLLYLNPQVWAGFPQLPARIPIYDISDPRKPVRKGFIQHPTSAAGMAHDTYVDHRPDGRSLMYSGSVHASDVFDVTDPFNARLLQRTASPEITISHDVQPTFDRKMIVVDDEGVLGGQLDESVSACGRVGGSGPAAVDSGSVHFYAAAPDGTFANGGAVELGSWNAPVNVNTGACVAHVFWQAPDENRLVQAYYRTGAFILDFDDPANVRMLGSFVATGGAMYWSAKPHCGYIYATDMDNGLDILRYTGERGRRWPATAGPADIQRAARQGVGRSGGACSARSRLEEFGRRTRVSLTLAAKRIPARGPLKVRVRNANGFAIRGRLSGQTVSRVSVSRKRRVKLRARSFRVGAGARKTVKLRLPKALRRVLKRTGKLRLRLTARVRDPAGDARTVKKRVTPRLKKKRRR